MTDFTYETTDIDALAVLTNYHRWILDEIRPFLGRRMAEIGAGIGTVTDLLAAARLERDPGAVLQAFEPATNLFQRLQARFKRDRRALLESGRLVLQHGYFQPAQRGFDTIVMINVLEHVERDAEMLGTLHASLEEQGSLIVFVPAMPWLYSAHDRAVGHHRRYVKAGLERLFAETGYDVLRCTYFDCLGVLPWYLLNVLFGARPTMNPGLAGLYDRWVVPLGRRLESRWPPAIGKNLLIVGRKKGA